MVKNLNSARKTVRCRVATVRRNTYGKKNCSKLSTTIGWTSWKQGERKRRYAPNKPLPGEWGKKGKESAESWVIESVPRWTKENRRQAENPRRNVDERKLEWREAPVKRLWEWNREGWKETNRKPSTRCLKKKHGKPGRRQDGIQQVWKDELKHWTNHCEMKSGRKERKKQKAE